MYGDTRGLDSSRQESTPESGGVGVSVRPGLQFL